MAEMGKGFAVLLVILAENSPFEPNFLMVRNAKTYFVRAVHPSIVLMPSGHPSITAPN